MGNIIIYRPLKLKGKMVELKSRRVNMEEAIVHI